VFSASEVARGKPHPDLFLCAAEPHEQIVHTIEEWFHNGAADGFNVMAAVLPGHLALFVEHVVPLLQKRGLFRSEYTAHTLRGHYGIARPVSQYAAQQSAAE